VLLILTPANNRANSAVPRYLSCDCSCSLPFDSTFFDGLYSPVPGSRSRPIWGPLRQVRDTLCQTHSGITEATLIRTTRGTFTNCLSVHCLLEVCRKLSLQLSSPLSMLEYFAHSRRFAVLIQQPSISHTQQSHLSLESCS
jgi:hypothetical protein